MAHSNRNERTPSHLHWTASWQSRGQPHLYAHTCSCSFAHAVLLQPQIGSVIRNPEVSSLVPALMAAIADPNAATKPALSLLLETVFVNTIDAASLVSASADLWAAGWCVG